MNITPQQKKGIIAGILVVIVAGGAFVYFDPLELNLLGLKAPPAAAKKSAVPPRTAASVAHPPAAVPKAASAPVAVSAPVQVTAPAASSPVEAPAKVLQPPVQSDKTIQVAEKTDQASQATSKPERAKDLDLRHCLELGTNAEIAKCAGE
jgi:hypothetical protein